MSCNYTLDKGVYCPKSPIKRISVVECGRKAFLFGRKSVISTKVWFSIIGSERSLSGISLNANPFEKFQTGGTLAFVLRFITPDMCCSAARGV
jgi:hypothetical protein